MMDCFLFTKMHGLGNDFVVIDQRYSNKPLDPSLIPILGNRRRGIGFDQLLTILPAKDDGDIFLKINNPLAKKRIVVQISFLNFSKFEIG